MKKIIASTVCLLMVLGFSGCSAENQSDNTTTQAETQVAAVAAKASTWEVISEQKFDFNSNIIGFDDENYGVSAGLGGEVHYYNTDSTDWPYAVNNSLCRFDIDFLDGGICYTCGNGGKITKSTDSGKTFNDIPDVVNDALSESRVISFCDEKNGIVSSDSRLMITSDGAASWKELSVPSKIVTIKMASPDVFYFIGNDCKLYKTTDGGANWNPTELNLPLGDKYKTKVNNFALTIDGEDAFTVFCIEDESKMIKSYSTTDGWATYVENELPEVNISIGTLYINRDGNLLTTTNSVSKELNVVKKQG